jgi:DNA-binding transcriptional LysR family regulator
MAATLDLDQIRTFVAIVETGSFTSASERVNKTQSAVSMQMRRLEDRIGKPIFYREGRNSRLTDDGERLLGYARRLLRLSNEAVAAFDDTELSGKVRLGTPDDYAERHLPEILARFSRSNPMVEVSVLCEPTVVLLQRMRAGELDLAIVTYVPGQPQTEIIRQEPLHWITSSQHGIEQSDMLPLALGQPDCCWRRTALDALDTAGRKYRLAYTSMNSVAVMAPVLAGLAVSVLPESCLKPGMRVLSEADGFPRLPPTEIGLLRSWQTTPTIDALAEHITSSLDNLSVPIAVSA